MYTLCFALTVPPESGIFRIMYRTIGRNICLFCGKNKAKRRVPPPQHTVIDRCSNALFDRFYSEFAHRRSIVYV